MVEPSWLTGRPQAANLAWVFPGQGSQYPGMGRDLAEAFPTALRLFQAADAALGAPLSRLCFEGPEEQLRLTANAQPAIFVTSLAVLAALEAAGALREWPAYMAGHSLGEYTALVAAGALSFAEGLRLVRERGRLMQRAGEEQPGSLVAVLGLEDEAAVALAAATGSEVCNYNAPGQLVLGGRKEAVAAVLARGREFGARRVVELNVSAAFHSSLMRPSVEGMAAALAGASLSEAAVPVVANGTALPLTHPQEIRQELAFQLDHPVQWRRSVEFLVGEGVRRFVEIGPGNVLAGLISRTVEGVQVCSVGSTEQVAALPT